MKKINLIYLLMVFFLLNCQEKSELILKNDNFISTISQKEKDGIKMYKQNLKIFDESKINYIQILVASPNETHLKEYLNNYSLKLKTKLKVNSLKKDLFDISSKESSLNQNEIKNVNDNAQEIYLETLSTSFDNGYSGYTILFEMKKNNAKTSKILAPWAYEIRFESNKFDDWLQLDRLPTGSPALQENSIKGYFEYTKCVFCSWKDDKVRVIYESDANQSEISTVDARRLRVTVDHNYSNYSVTCGNW